MPCRRPTRIPRSHDTSRSALVDQRANGGRIVWHPKTLPADPRTEKDEMTPSVHTRRNLLLGAVLGLTALAEGVPRADAFLPEWRAGQPLGEAIYRERVREVAARAGL